MNNFNEAMQGENQSNEGINGLGDIRCDAETQNDRKPEIQDAFGSLDAENLLSKEASEAQNAQESQETTAAAEASQPEGVVEEKNPFLEYMRNAFSKPHIDEFMNTLTDDQKSFVYVFCSGFETAIGRHIVGVYDSSYIEGFHFTKDVLDSLRIVIKPVNVKDSDLKFTIVAQLI